MPTAIRSACCAFLTAVSLDMPSTAFLYYVPTAALPLPCSHCSVPALCSHCSVALSRVLTAATTGVSRISAPRPLRYPESVTIGSASKSYGDLWTALVHLSRRPSGLRRTSATTRASTTAAHRKISKASHCTNYFSRPAPAKCSRQLGKEP